MTGSQLPSRESWRLDARLVPEWDPHAKGASPHSLKGWCLLQGFKFPSVTSWSPVLVASWGR